MTDSYSQNEVIGHQFLNALLEINNHWNIGFHSHVSEVNESIGQYVSVATERLLSHILMTTMKTCARHPGNQRSLNKDQSAGTPPAWRY